MVALPHYPATLLREAKMLWELMGMTIGGGQTGSGVMPISRLDGGGLWKASLTEVAMASADHRRTWRALSAITDGGAQPIIVPVRETVDAPWPLVDGVALTSLDNVPHSDGALFSDGSGYDSNAINATVSGPVALRATALTVSIAVGQSLRGGEYFSIDHETLRWRLYRVATAIDNGDGTNAITFRPPLRAAITGGTWLEFDRPKCVMRLATPDAMDVMMEKPFFARPSVSFIEAFPPFPS